MRQFVGGFLAGTTAATTAATIVEWRRSRAAGEVPFDRLRIWGNEQLNPWLLRRGMAGGRLSEIGTIEHVGRKTGTVHFTPIHPTLTPDGRVWIPVPYGEKSQWAQNVLAAGHARLQLHEMLYDLDQPAMVGAGEFPVMSPLTARFADWLGVRYLRLQRVAEVPGEFEVRQPAAMAAGEPRPEPPLGTAFELPLMEHLTTQARHAQPALAEAPAEAPEPVMV